jgi:hypothetical protein
LPKGLVIEKIQSLYPMVIEKKFIIVPYGDWNFFRSPKDMITKFFNRHKVYNDQNKSNFNHLWACLGQLESAFDLGWPKLTMYWHDTRVQLCPNVFVKSWWTHGRGDNPIYPCCILCWG